MKHFFILAAAVFLLIACEEEMKPPSGSEEQPPTENEDSTVPDTDPTPVLISPQLDNFFRFILIIFPRHKPCIFVVFHGFGCIFIHIYAEFMHIYSFFVANFGG